MEEGTPHRAPTLGLQPSASRQDPRQLCYSTLYSRVRASPWTDVAFGGRATNRSPRKFWSFALLFERPCADAEEVETSLIQMRPPPYLTVPYLTLRYLTLPYLTLP